MQFGVGDAPALPLETEVYDAVVSGLMLNFTPWPAQAVGGEGRRGAGNRRSL